MHQQKGKIILIYFFLLLILGSINNHSLNRIQFEKKKLKHINSNRNNRTKIKTQSIIRKKKLRNIKEIQKLEKTSK